MIRVLLVAAVALVVGVAVAFVADATPVVALTAAVAVYGAALASLQTLFDRHDLRADFGAIRAPGPELDDGEVHVRLYNRGRRPVRVEAAGFEATPSGEPLEFEGWWGTIPPRVQDNPLAATLDEQRPSIDLVAFPAVVADWYAPSWMDPPTWLFARLGHGQTRRWELPGNVRALLAEAWSGAQAKQARREFKRGAGIPEPTDDYGSPLPDR